MFPKIQLSNRVKGVLIVFTLHMSAYYGLWLLFGWLGCGLGWVPSWCPQPLP